MKYSMGTLFWLVAVFAAFMLGPTLREFSDPMTPVLVAARNVDVSQFLKKDDFRVVRRRASTVPFGVLTRKSQIDDHGLTRSLLAGQYIFPRDLQNFAGMPNVPNGYLVQAVILGNEEHSLINHLLSAGDRVSIRGVKTGEDGEETSETVANNQRGYNIR